MRRSRRHLGRALSVLAGLALVATPADARQFSMTRVGSGTYVLVDPQAVESIPGGVVRRTWVVSVQRNILSGETPLPGYVRTLTDYDCVTRASRWRTFQAYARSGELLMTRDNPAYAWTPVDTAPDVLVAYRTVCEGNAGASVIAADGIAKVVIALMASWDPPPKPAVKADPKAAKSPPAGGKAAAAKPPVAAVRPVQKAAPKT